MDFRFGADAGLAAGLRATGRTGGESYQRKMLDLVPFTEIWSLQTQALSKILIFSSNCDVPRCE